MSMVIKKYKIVNKIYKFWTFQQMSVMNVVSVRMLMKMNFCYAKNHM